VHQLAEELCDGRWSICRMGIPGCLIRCDAQGIAALRQVTSIGDTGLQILNLPGIVVPSAQLKPEFQNELLDTK
jgi:hypothetical protein